jgi:hypothetical protein
MATEQFNGVTYSLYDEFLNFEAAEVVCRDVAGGHLASVSSQEEWDVLARLVAKTADEPVRAPPS